MADICKALLIDSIGGVALFLIDAFALSASLNESNENF